MPKGKRSLEKKKGGVPNKQRLQSLVQAAAPEAIQKLISLMNCGQPAVEQGAAKTILNKAIPDMKAVEWRPSDDGDGFVMKVEYVKNSSKPTS